MTNYVIGFYYDPTDKRCLLMHRLKKDWQEGLANGIGGKTTKNDPHPLASMIREFREETGIETIESQWSHVLTLTSNANIEAPWEIYVFRGFGELPRHFRYESPEGVVTDEHVPPDNMERTARWLYWMCKDLSLTGVKIEGIL